MMTLNELRKEKPRDCFRIVSREFGYEMYAASLPMGTPPWSDRIEDAYVYDHRDNREFKLKFWRGMASFYGLNPECVHIEEAEAATCAS